MTYPNYTRAERIADGIIHVLGIGAALAAVGVLCSLIGQQGPGTRMAAHVYGTALLLMLGASGAYHMAAHTRARPVLRRIDHAAIYLKIAGTFTPLGVLLGTAFAHVMLVLVWALALAGAMSKLMARPGRMSTGWAPQVALGWLGLAILIPLWPSLPGPSIALIIAGGVIYTVAVVFYVWEGLRYGRAIWHGFVLIATGCFYVGIMQALTTRA